MQFQATEIAEVIKIRPKVISDSRGFFMESWHERAFADAGIDVRFVQDNHSHSVRYTLRGLHYQSRQVQGKLVRVVLGSVFDVAVDIRRNSPTLGRSVSAILSDQNHQMLWIPPGFAHGFLVLSAHADLLYSCTDFWAPGYERTILWNDPDLNLPWPLPPGVAPLLSTKDEAAVRFRDAEYLE